MPGDEMQHDAIDEARHALPPFAKATKGRSRAYDPGRPRRSVCGRVAQTPDGTMLTVLRPRDSPNCTFPSTSAKSVSSPPRPTFAPGWNLVPRCRTRISPAWTDWPPKRLTPSRCAFESRPLRELDAPFLCAIGSLPRLLDTGDLDDRQRLTVAL